MDPVASASPCVGIKDVHHLNCLVFVLKSALSRECPQLTLVNTHFTHLEVSELTIDG